MKLPRTGKSKVQRTGAPQVLIRGKLTGARLDWAIQSHHSRTAERWHKFLSASRYRRQHYTPAVVIWQRVQQLLAEGLAREHVIATARNMIRMNTRG